MSGDVLGYIVVAWVGDTHLQTLGRQILHDDIEWARDAARGMQEQADSAGDNLRYAVHPVSATPDSGAQALRAQGVPTATITPVGDGA